MIMNVSPVDIGRRLRESRVAAHVSQAKLSDQTGISIGTISRLERGVYEPSISTLYFMSQALGATLDFLIMGSVQDAPLPMDSSITRKLCTHLLKFKPSDQRLLLAIIDVIIRHRLRHSISGQQEE